MAFRGPEGRLPKQGCSKCRSGFLSHFGRSCSSKEVVRLPLASHPFVSKLKLIQCEAWYQDSLQGRKVGEEAGGGFGSGSYCKLI